MLPNLCSSTSLLFFFFIPYSLFSFHSLYSCYSLVQFFLMYFIISVRQCKQHVYHFSLHVNVIRYNPFASYVRREHMQTTECHWALKLAFPLPVLSIGDWLAIDLIYLHQFLVWSCYVAVHVELNGMKSRY